jgi:hypothetical protein
MLVKQAFSNPDPAGASIEATASPGKIPESADVVWGQQEPVVSDRPGCPFDSLLEYSENFRVANRREELFRAVKEPPGFDGSEKRRRFGNYDCE